MGTRQQWLVLKGLRGRDGGSAPIGIPEDQCAEMVNVHVADGGLVQKRYGCSARALLTSGGGATFITTNVNRLYKHIPSASLDTSRLVVFDDDAPTNVGWLDENNYWTQVASYSSGTNETLDNVSAVSFNGKLFIASQVTASSGSLTDQQKRPRVLAYENSGHVLRRMGLWKPVAAPAAATNAGIAGPASSISRQYKVCLIRKDGTDIVLRSEPSAASAALSNNATKGITVTFDASSTSYMYAGEPATHWEVYGSWRGSIWHLLSTIEVATTTYDDTGNPKQYSGDSYPEYGTNQVPTYWKYITTDGARILGCGSYEVVNQGSPGSSSSTEGAPGFLGPPVSGGLSGNNNRVWFTPARGALDVGDDERIPNTVDFKYWVDVDSDGEPLTGIFGGFGGSTYVFSHRHIWRMTPTGDPFEPFRVATLSRTIGAISHWSIVCGEDEMGNPALYFLSSRGPYRIGSRGLEYCGHDIEDVWATRSVGYDHQAHGVWHGDRHQVWWWLTTGAQTSPGTCVVFDALRARSTELGTRGGWVKYTGRIATALCSCMFGKSIASSVVSKAERPYIGQTGYTPPKIDICDDLSTSVDDAGTDFQAYITTKPYELAGLGRMCGVGQPSVTAAASSSATALQLTINQDYGKETRTSTCSLAATASETRVQRKFEGADASQCGVVQFTIGDSAANETQWTLDAVAVPWSDEGER